MASNCRCVSPSVGDSGGTVGLGKHGGYKDWAANRSGRLPQDGKAFKEMRNVSMKEGPVENDSVVINFNPPLLDPHETYTSPWIDTRTGAIAGKGTVTSVNGVVREAEGIPVHDFGVTVESNGKTYNIPAFVTAAAEYLDALADEINEAERLFGRG